MRLSTHWTSRLARLALTLLLLVAWCGQPELLRAQAGRTPATQPSAEDLKRLADEMERAFVALEAADKQIPRDTFEPQAIVSQVGREPAKLYAWVRDNTYWVAYRAALRGPAGVLMDRLGSSLDRALLLAELLRIAGHTARLARAQLTDEQATELLSTMRPVPEEPLPVAASAAKPDADAMAEQYAKQYNLDLSTYRRNAPNNTLRAAKLAEDAAQRVADQTEAIVQLVGKPSDQDRAQFQAKEAAERLKSLQDHWWVQHKVGDAWVDLDLLAPDSANGKAMAHPTETIGPDPKTGRIPIDGKHYHEVTVRVFIEQWTKQDGLKEKRVLEHALRPFELFGQRVAMAHIPMDWPRDLKLFGQKDVLEKLKATALAEYQWTPTLYVGNSVISEMSFTDTGETSAVDLNAWAKQWGFKAAGARTGDILGTGAIGNVGAVRTSKPPAADGAQLTAEWVEYEIRVPGNQNRVLRRQVFDLLGPDARAGKQPPPPPDEQRRLQRAYALMGEVELLPVVTKLSAPFVLHLLFQNLLGNRAVLLEMLRRGDKTNPQDVAQQMEKIRRLPARLYWLAMARHQWNPHATEIYLDHPNLLNFYSHIRPDSQGMPVLRTGFDIIENGVALRLAPGATGDPFVLRLASGVVDTNAEALLMWGGNRPENTANLWEWSTAQGTEWIVIRSVTEKAWSETDLPQDARALIQLDLSAGNNVIVPRKALTLDGRAVTAWWRLDPTTGQLLGMTQDGRGGVSAEVKLHLAVVISAVSTALTFIVCEKARRSGERERGEEVKTVHGYCIFCTALAGVLNALGWIGEVPGAESMFGGLAKWAAGYGGAGVGTAVGTLCAVFGPGS